MMRGGDIPAGHPAALLPPMLGDTPSLWLPVPRVLGVMPSAALVGFHVTKTPVRRHGVGRCPGGAATWALVAGLAPGCGGLGAGSARPGHAHLQLLELIETYKCVYIYIYEYMYMKINRKIEKEIEIYKNT